MGDQAPQRELGGSLQAALREEAGAERYQRYQQRMRSGRARDVARPREFDANGFPLPQRSRSFVERVAQLLNPL